MIPLDLPWRLIGAVATLALLIGGVAYFGHVRYKAGYAAHQAEVAQVAREADERYRARRPRGDPALRELLTYRAEPERLVVRVPVQVNHDGDGESSCLDRSDEYFRMYNELAGGKVPAGTVP